MTPRLRPHKIRRVTDEQIAVLKAWVPFNQLARSMGINPRYASELRTGKKQYKTSVP